MLIDVSLFNIPTISSQNVTLVTMVAAVILVLLVLATRSSQPRVTPLTVMQRRHVMVFPIM